MNPIPLVSVLLLLSLPEVFKGFTIQALKYAWENTLGSPPQPSAPPIQIQDLCRRKKYFYTIGYLPSSASLDDYLDQQTISAFKTYQEYFNLHASYRRLKQGNVSANLATAMCSTKFLALRPVITTASCCGRMEYWSWGVSAQ
ncbi:hypothetical protein VNO78_09089 [Psophocarpus tetragonolobus]|uniref:Uncharacterized protein n=1 Tax=Psophocarpus tetragonolobus TaxID=3891 RepID=A0AAN9SVW6_PSOTE